MLSWSAGCARGFREPGSERTIRGFAGAKLISQIAKISVIVFHAHY